MQVIKLFAIFLVSAIVMLLNGCSKNEDEKKKVKEIDADITKPLQMERIKLDILDFGLRFPAISSGMGEEFLQKPAFIFKVRITNTSKAKVEYSPKHRAAEKFEETYPQLQEKEGAKIPSVILQPGAEFVALQNDVMMLEPGEAIEDYFMYQNPGRGGKTLVWTIPGSMFLENAIIKYKFEYTYAAPKLPDPEPWDTGVRNCGNNTLQFTGSEFLYVSVTDGVNQGVSPDPHFVIRFKMKNIGDKPWTYKPYHNHPQGISTNLTTLDGIRIKRALYAKGVDVVGQIEDRMVVNPGEEVQDMVMFDPPPMTEKEVILTLGLSPFGCSGILRMKVPYEWKELEKPDLTAPTDEKDKKKDKDKPK